MPAVNVEGFDLDRSESLLVAYSPSLGAWVASVGNLEAVEQRELTQGGTAAEALGLLFVALGSTLQGTS